MASMIARMSVAASGVKVSGHDAGSSGAGWFSVSIPLILAGCDHAGVIAMYRHPSDPTTPGRAAAAP
jgi:hypothetical protein